MSPPELAALVDKYERLRALRAARATGEPPAPREALRALAARFPGALRELERATDAELEAREAAARRALEGGALAEATLVWALFHRHLLAALEARRPRPAEDASAGPLPHPEAAREPRPAPPAGRQSRAALERLVELTGLPRERVAEYLHLRPTREGRAAARRQPSPSGGEP